MIDVKEDLNELVKILRQCLTIIEQLCQDEEELDYLIPISEVKKVLYKQRIDGDLSYKSLRKIIDSLEAIPQHNISKV